MHTCTHARACARACCTVGQLVHTNYKCMTSLGVFCNKIHFDSLTHSESYFLMDM